MLAPWQEPLATPCQQQIQLALAREPKIKVVLKHLPTDTLQLLDTAIDLSKHCHVKQSALTMTGQLGRGFGPGEDKAKEPISSEFNLDASATLPAPLFWATFSSASAFSRIGSVASRGRGMTGHHLAMAGPGWQLSS